MRSARTSVVLMTGVLLTLAGCGDDDNTMTAAAYRDAGNGVCRDADAAISAAIPNDTPTVEVARTELAPKLIDALSAIRDEMDDLSPPDSLQRDHTQFVAAFDSATAVLDEAIDDAAAMEQLLAEGPPLDEIGELAAKLGLTACTGDS